MRRGENKMTVKQNQSQYKLNRNNTFVSIKKRKGSIPLFLCKIFAEIYMSNVDSINYSFLIDQYGIPLFMENKHCGITPKTLQFISYKIKLMHND